MKRSMNAKKLLALMLGLMLTLGLFAGCGDSNNGSTGRSSENSSQASSQVSSEVSSQPEENQAEDISITLKVVHGDKSTKDFEFSTQAKTLRDALEQEGLISGDEGQYGLFVKTVDGETVDDGNQEWWCLTKGGEMWTEGVDSTELSDGDVYEFTFTVGY